MENTPSMQAAGWLENFDAALKLRDIDAALGLFQDDC